MNVSIHEFFRKNRKAVVRAAVVSVAFLVLLVVVVNTMCNYPSRTTVIAPSGRYILQHVSVGRVWMMGGMGYLRVIDRQHPEKAYRTPLYSTQSLDMRLTEDEETVGVYWLYFNKKERTFDIAMPQWEWHWLNIFISNTPYTDMENG